MSKQLQ